MSRLGYRSVEAREQELIIIFNFAIIDAFGNLILLHQVYNVRFYNLQVCNVRFEATFL